MIAQRIICIVLGYFFGLIEMGYILGKIKNIDIRDFGSGNSGTTNTMRVLGKKAGLITFFVDALKAVFCGLLVYALFHKSCENIMFVLLLYSGFGVILGHNFPFYMKFKGGKGIASSVGIVFAFDWRMVPICAILFFTSVVPMGFMSLGSLGILSGFFVQTIVFGQLGLLKIATQFLPETYVLAGILTALAFWQHRANIKRLATGTENKFRPAKKEN